MSVPYTPTRRTVAKQVVGTFDDDGVRQVLGAARQEAPVCLLPVGRPG